MLKSQNFIDEKLSEEGDPKGLPFSIGIKAKELKVVTCQMNTT